MLTKMQDYFTFLKHIYYLSFHGVNLSLSWLVWACRCYNEDILKWVKSTKLAVKLVLSVVLHNEGKSERVIASQLKLSKTCVLNTITRYKETDCNQDRSRSERLRATTSREDKFVITSKWNRRITAPQICTEVNKSRSKPVSVTTVKRRLRVAKLFCRVAVQKSLLRQQNKMKQMHWALTHGHWTEEDF